MVRYGKSLSDKEVQALRELSEGTDRAAGEAE